MTSDMETVASETTDRALGITTRILKAAREMIAPQATGVAPVDPVFEGLVRNRVTAELLKASLRLPQETVRTLGYGPDIQEGMAEYLLSTQTEAGGWHEIHPRYDEPSGLITAFVAEAMLELLKRPEAISNGLQDRVETSLRDAVAHVLSKEQAPGYFLKSERYRADHLNVDATCGAFLARAGEWLEHQPALDAADRVVGHLAEHQEDDGAYPYTTGLHDETYPYPLRIPCIHYQGVTAHYLSQIHQVTGSQVAKDSLIQAAEWLADVQQHDGRFDWSRSQLMFVWYVTGAYAFGASLFSYTSRWEPDHQDRATNLLEELDGMVPGLAWRWEPAHIVSLPNCIGTSYNVANVSGYPLRARVLRLGYCFYRELARRRSSDQVEDRLFRILQRTLNLQASTVDPSHNHPDLFMSSEISDALSSLLLHSDPGRELVDDFQVIRR